MSGAVAAVWQRQIAPVPWGIEDRGKDFPYLCKNLQFDAINAPCFAIYGGNPYGMRCVGHPVIEGQVSRAKA